MSPGARGAQRPGEDLVHPRPWITRGIQSYQVRTGWDRRHPQRGPGHPWEPAHPHTRRGWRDPSTLGPGSPMGAGAPWAPEWLVGSGGIWCSPGAEDEVQPPLPGHRVDPPSPAPGAALACSDPLSKGTPNGGPCCCSPTPQPYHLPPCPLGTCAVGHKHQELGKPHHHHGVIQQT